MPRRPPQQPAVLRADHAAVHLRFRCVPRLGFEHDFGRIAPPMFCCRFCASVRSVSIGGEPVAIVACLLRSALWGAGLVEGSLSQCLIPRKGGRVCVMDSSFWLFRRYFATVFLLDSPTFAVAVFARVVLRGLLGSFFPAELFTGLSPRGEGARVFPLNWKALPTSKTCVCVRMLESAPGTRPSAQFDCLDLGLAVCIRVAAVLLRVLVASPSPSLLCPGARDFFDFLCRCLCSAALSVLVLLLRCFACFP